MVSNESFLSSVHGGAGFKPADGDLRRRKNYITMIILTIAASCSSVLCAVKLQFK